MVTGAELLNRTPQQVIQQNEQERIQQQQQQEYERQQQQLRQQQQEYERQVAESNAKTERYQKGYQAGYQASFTGESLSGEYDATWRAGYAAGRASGDKEAGANVSAAGFNIYQKLPELSKMPESIYSNIVQKPTGVSSYQYNLAYNKALNELRNKVTTTPSQFTLISTPQKVYDIKNLPVDTTKSKEVYGGGVFISPSVSGGTGIIRMPTPEEQAKFEAVKVKEAKLWDVLSLEYFERKMLGEQKYAEAQARVKGYRQNIEKANPLLYKPLKLLSTGTVTTAETITGAKIPEPLKTQTQQVIQDIYTAGLFAPAIRTASYQENEDIFKFEKARKKGKLSDVVTLEQQQAKEISSKELENAIREAYLRGETERIREVYRIALARGDANSIKVAETLLKNALGDKVASTIIKDVATQEAMTTSTPQLFKLVVNPSPIVPVNLEQAPTALGLLAINFPKQERKLFPVNAVAPLLKNNTKEILGVVSVPKIKGEYQLSTPAQNQFSITTPVSISTTVTKQKELLKQVQQTRQLQRTKTELQTRQVEPETFNLKSDSQILGASKLKKALFKFARGYKAQVKRKGKYFDISGALPRAKALQVGEMKARETLVASFRIVPTKTEIATTGEKTYLPNPKIFRSFKIRRGMRIPLTDEFIQNARFRLSSRGERTEIMRAKKQKGGKFRWL